MRRLVSILVVLSLLIIAAVALVGCAAWLSSRGVELPGARMLTLLAILTAGAVALWWLGRTAWRHAAPQRWWQWLRQAHHNRALVRGAHRMFWLEARHSEHHLTRLLLVLTGEPERSRQFLVRQGFSRTCTQPRAGRWKARLRTFVPQVSQRFSGEAAAPSDTPTWWQSGKTACLLIPATESPTAIEAIAHASASWQRSTKAVDTSPARRLAWALHMPPGATTLGSTSLVRAATALRRAVGQPTQAHLIMPTTAPLGGDALVLPCDVEAWQRWIHHQDANALAALGHDPQRDQDALEALRMSREFRDRARDLTRGLDPDNQQAGRVYWRSVVIEGPPSSTAAPGILTTENHSETNSRPAVAALPDSNAVLQQLFAPTATIDPTGERQEPTTKPTLARLSSQPLRTHSTSQTPLEERRGPFGARWQRVIATISQWRYTQALGHRWLPALVGTAVCALMLTIGLAQHTWLNRIGLAAQRARISQNAHPPSRKASQAASLAPVASFLVSPDRLEDWANLAAHPSHPATRWCVGFCDGAASAQQALQEGYRRWFANHAASPILQHHLHGWAGALAHAQKSAEANQRLSPADVGPLLEALSVHHALASGQPLRGREPLPSWALTPTIDAWHLALQVAKGTTGVPSPSVAAPRAAADAATVAIRAWRRLSFLNGTAVDPSKPPANLDSVATLQLSQPSDAWWQNDKLREDTRRLLRRWSPGEVIAAAVTHARRSALATHPDSFGHWLSGPTPAPTLTAAYWQEHVAPRLTPDAIELYAAWLGLPGGTNSLHDDAAPGHRLRIMPPAPRHMPHEGANPLNIRVATATASGLTLASTSILGRAQDDDAAQGQGQAGMQLGWREEEPVASNHDHDTTAAVHQLAATTRQQALVDLVATWRQWLRQVQIRDLENCERVQQALLELLDEKRSELLSVFAILNDQVALAPEPAQAKLARLWHSASSALDQEALRTAAVERKLDGSGTNANTVAVAFKPAAQARAATLDPTARTAQWFRTFAQVGTPSLLPGQDVPLQPYLDALQQIAQAAENIVAVKRSSSSGLASPATTELIGAVQGFRAGLVAGHHAATQVANMSRLGPEDQALLARLLRAPLLAASRSGCGLQETVQPRWCEAVWQPHRSQLVGHFPFASSQSTDAATQQLQSLLHPSSGAFALLTSDMLKQDLRAAAHGQRSPTPPGDPRAPLADGYESDAFVRALNAGSDLTQALFTGSPASSEVAFSVRLRPLSTSVVRRMSLKLGDQILDHEVNAGGWQQPTPWRRIVWRWGEAASHGSPSHTFEAGTDSVPRDDASGEAWEPNAGIDEVDAADPQVAILKLAGDRGQTDTRRFAGSWSVLRLFDSGRVVWRPGQDGFTLLWTSHNLLDTIAIDVRPEGTVNPFFGRQRGGPSHHFLAPFRSFGRITPLAVNHAAPCSEL